MDVTSRRHGLADPAPDYDPASARSEIAVILARAAVRQASRRGRIELAVPPGLRLSVSTGAAPDADRQGPSR